MRELTQCELDHVSGGWRFGAAMVALANSNDRNGDGDGFDETSSDLFAGAAATGSAAWAAARVPGGQGASLILGGAAAYLGAAGAAFYVMDQAA